MAKDREKEKGKKAKKVRLDKNGNPKKKMSKKKKILLGVVGFLIFMTVGTIMTNKDKNTDSSSGNDFLSGFDTISYPKAYIGNKLVNKFYIAIAKSAEGKESWSEKDGTALYNQSYGKYKQNQFNIYFPKDLDKSKDHSIVLCIHGGQWCLGSKECMDWMAKRAAKNGFIGVTMGYSLNSFENADLARATGSMEHATIFTMLDDITACLTTVNELCTNLDISVTGAALAGESAGAHLSALYAYSRADESPIPIKMIFVATLPTSMYADAYDTYKNARDFVPVVEAALDCKITVDQVTERNALIDAVSPVYNINENSCPTLIAFAGNDHTVGMKQCPTIEPVLQENGVPYKILWFENSDHTLNKDKGMMKTYTDEAFKWMKVYCDGTMSEDELTFGNTNPALSDS